MIYSQYEQGSHSCMKSKVFFISKPDPITQALISGLKDCTLECLICTERILDQPIPNLLPPIWNCSYCHQLFHMECISKWANKKQTDITDWSCPNCRYTHTIIPSNSLFTCFCKKKKYPKYNNLSQNIPYSCGKICAKPKRHDGRCPHPCPLICHPGPCPPCSATIVYSCHCGSISRAGCCGDQIQPYSCESICTKKLPYCDHPCPLVCHSGPCPPCKQTILQSCDCGKRTDILFDCSQINIKMDRAIACDITCDKPFPCMIHYCQKKCHNSNNDHDNHNICPLSPQILTHCPCGKSVLKNRTRCTDLIEIDCTNICNKLLPCNRHYCPRICHSDSCIINNIACKELEKISCPCGVTKATIECNSINNDQNIFTIECKKTCQKKPSNCSIHKCGRICCTNSHIDDKCQILCKKLLLCKKHICNKPCHKGFPCPPCLEADFYTEYVCSCGKTRIDPPIPCGTILPPTCPFNCHRQTLCGHVQISHPCHPNAVACPPCEAICPKISCICGKKTFDFIRCCISKVKLKCDQPCLMHMKHCGHLCMERCHIHNSENEYCNQQCSKLLSCGHQCRMPCSHDHDHDVYECEMIVDIHCPCSRITRQIQCKISNSDSELQCDDECKRLDRCKRLAEALNIIPKEQEEKKIVTFPLPIIEFCRMIPKWVNHVEQTLEAFIQGKINRYCLDFKPMGKRKTAALISIASSYPLEIITLDKESKCSIRVSRRDSNETQSCWKMSELCTWKMNSIVEYMNQSINTEKILSIPDFDSWNLFPHQIAGHPGTILSPSEPNDIYIAKQLIQREYEFYKDLTLHCHDALLSFFPKYYGIAYSNGQPYLILENILHSMILPSSIDIKLGYRTFDDYADSSKREMMYIKDCSTTTCQLGIRISGVHFRDQDTVFDKNACKEISSNEHSLKQCISSFFFDTKLRRMFLDMLNLLIQALSTSHELVLYSSSLLIAYDIKDQDEYVDIRLKLLDFAHSHWGKSSDYSIEHDILDPLYQLSNMLKSIDT